MITAALALLLCAALLTACASKPEQPEATSGNAAAEPTATVEAAAEPTATAEATAEPTSAPTPTPPEEPKNCDGSPLPVDTSAPVTPEKNGLYDALCDLFSNYHEGTAGCSLTGARIAATIMDYAIENDVNAVRAGAAAFDLGDETEFGEKMSDKLTAMYETALSLYGESGEGLLRDSGYTPTHYPYAAKDIHETFTAIFTERGYETPLVVRLYRADANAESFLTFGMRAEGTELTAEALNGVMDGLIFENGAAFNAVSADENGRVRADLNEAFAAQVRALGTTGEYYLVGGVVNTLLDAFDGTDVMLTVNGAALETGHNIYDTALTRFD